jgi:hypothetical protein
LLMLEGEPNETFPLPLLRLSSVCEAQD